MKERTACAVVELYAGPRGFCTKCWHDIAFAVVTIQDRPNGALCVRTCAACLTELMDLPSTQVLRSAGDA